MPTDHLYLESRDGSPSDNGQWMVGYWLLSLFGLCPLFVADQDTDTVAIHNLTPTNSSIDCQQTTFGKAECRIWGLIVNRAVGDWV